LGWDRPYWGGGVYGSASAAASAAAAASANAAAAAAAGAGAAAGAAASGYQGYVCEDMRGCAVPGYGVVPYRAPLPGAAPGYGGGYAGRGGVAGGTYGYRCDNMQGCAVPGYGVTPYGAPMMVPGVGCDRAVGCTLGSGAYGTGIEGGGRAYGSGYPGTTSVGGGYQGGAAVIVGRAPVVPMASARPPVVAQPGPAPAQGYTSAQPTPASGGQCNFVDSTVVKSIRAMCVANDGHEFPASRMSAATWINSGFEGEIARCLPGSRLKAMIGSVVNSDQGMSTTLEGGQSLQCGTGEALRHYKNGMLKCAPAEKVPDCTERDNLRKYGTGDMFFTYVSRVCQVPGRQAAVGGQSRAAASSSATASASSSSFSTSSSSASAGAAANSRFLTLRGMVLNGGVGDRY
jgi:hypothetical protein